MTPRKKPRTFKVWVGVNCTTPISHTARTTRAGVKLALTHEIGEDWPEYCDVVRATLTLAPPPPRRRP